MIKKMKDLDEETIKTIKNLKRLIRRGKATRRIFVRDDKTGQLEGIKCKKTGKMKLTLRSIDAIVELRED